MDSHLEAGNFTVQGPEFRAESAFATKGEGAELLYARGAVQS